MGVRLEWTRFLIAAVLTSIVIIVLDIAFHQTLARPRTLLRHARSERCA